MSEKKAAAAATTLLDLAEKGIAIDISDRKTRVEMEIQLFEDLIYTKKE